MGSKISTMSRCAWHARKTLMMSSGNIYVNSIDTDMATTETALPSMNSLPPMAGRLALKKEPSLLDVDTDVEKPKSALAANVMPLKMAGYSNR